MKNVIFRLFVILSFIVFFNSQTSFALPIATQKANNTPSKISASEISESEAEVIKRFSIKNKFHRTPETQIKKFYSDFNKYSEKNDIEKLKEMYSDSFVNNDGYDKNVLFEVFSKAVDVYKDIEYTTEILSVAVENNYATVKIHEFAIGNTAEKHRDINDYGLISSDMYHTDYLKKEGNKWKITSSVIESEEIALKYGETKLISIELSAPKTVPAGSDYDVSVHLKSPDGVMVIGSIVNEPIIHPQIQKQDVFKSVKSDILERVLKANKDNYNEYATVTIGITRASVDPPQLVFSMTGMAVVMTRVNVLNKLN